MMITIGLISCAKTKGKERALAKDLYQSPLFRKSYNYARREYDTTFILSAWHGLVDPFKTVAPYEFTFNSRPAKWSTPKKKKNIYGRYTRNVGHANCAVCL